MNRNSSTVRRSTASLTLMLGAATLAMFGHTTGADAAVSIEVIPSLERALDRGLELTPAGGELVVLPTYTAMLALRKIVAERGFARPYWERAA